MRPDDVGKLFADAAVLRPRESAGRAWRWRRISGLVRRNAQLVDTDRQLSLHGEGEGMGWPWQVWRSSICLRPMREKMSKIDRYQLRAGLWRRGARPGWCRMARVRSPA